jgi:hypothetical protein
MATESLLVTLSDATTDKYFYLVSRQGFKSVWAREDNSVDDQSFIIIDHQLKAPGSQGSDRHSIGFRREKVDSTTKELKVQSATLNIVTPRTNIFTSTHNLDMTKIIQCLLKTTFTSGIFIDQTLSGDYHCDSYVPA